MDLIGLLMVALAKSEGDMSSDQKVEIDLVNNMHKILEPSIGKFSDKQAHSNRVHPEIAFFQSLDT
jgi:hypothetical protein